MSLSSLQNLIKLLTALTLTINPYLRVAVGMPSIPPFPVQCHRNITNNSVTFEPCPSDYSVLKMHTLPLTGGDTLWASTYEAYDRLSHAFRTFLEGLTAIHSAQCFNTVTKRHGSKVHTGPRGAPDNVGSALRAIHPVIRTNPVTGWKALFVNKEYHRGRIKPTYIRFTKRIVEVTKDESDAILEYLFRHISENHDLQVRFKWNINDMAIWDNRSVLHTAT
jgi:alpha-ketoglutarate-dependent taurine dioxygenase